MFRIVKKRKSRNTHSRINKKPKLASSANDDCELRYSNDKTNNLTDSLKLFNNNGIASVAAADDGVVMQQRPQPLPVMLNLNVRISTVPNAVDLNFTEINSNIHKPMLANNIKTLNKLDYSNYMYELKFDGERLLYKYQRQDNMKITFTRQLKRSNIFKHTITFSENCSECILDGELVYIHPDSNKIVPISDTGRRDAHILHYKIFDIQSYNNESTLNYTYLQRRNILTEQLFKDCEPSNFYSISDAFECKNYEFLMSVYENYIQPPNNGEGLILKNKYEFYLPDTRNWIKVKLLNSIDVDLYAYEFLKDKNGIYNILICGFYYDSSTDEIKTDRTGQFNAVCRVSSGLTKNLRESLILRLDKNGRTFNSTPTIVTIHAMSVTKLRKSLRHPKIHSIRYDLNELNSIQLTCLFRNVESQTLE